MSAYPKRNTSDMTTVFNSSLISEFIEEDEDYRYAYAEDFLNTYIATQIRVLREQRRMKQADLAKAIGTKQSGISRLENVNYSNWGTETLKKIARALGVRLRISFETFGSLVTEDAEFSKKNLKRDKFEDDPVFKKKGARKSTGKLAQFSPPLNTGFATDVRNFKGDPAQARFEFMEQPMTAISKPTNTLPRVTVKDFIDANRDLVLAYWASRNVAEKEAA